MTNTDEQIEEIVITQQPAEPIQAPTAKVQTDETITTTTNVEEQQQPTFQASSSATQPEVKYSKSKS